MKRKTLLFILTFTHTLRDLLYSRYPVGGTPLGYSHGLVAPGPKGRYHEIKAGY